MGKHQLRLLKFVITYPGWHCLSKRDPAARKALNSLEAMGLVQVERHGGAGAQWQFRLTPPTYVQSQPDCVTYANRSLTLGSIGG